MATRNDLKEKVQALATEAEESGEDALASMLLVVAASLIRDTDSRLWEHTLIFARSELKAIEASRN